jgi:hypothetical protein
MTDTRHTVLRALRDLCDAKHPDITPRVVSRHCGQPDDYAWQEMARCRADGLADRTDAPMCSWFITSPGRAWLDEREAEVA